MAGEQLPHDLLDDVSGDGAEARAALLRWLLDKGLGVEELREAKRERRLALLPTEHVLTQGCRHSFQEAIAAAGLDPEFVVRVWRAAGIPIPEGDEPILDDEDLEAMRTAKRVLDAGLSEEAYLDITRVVGRASAPTAQALVEVVVAHFLEPGAGEDAFAIGLEAVAERLTPLLPILLSFPVRLHLRDALRHQAIEQRAGGISNLADTRVLSIGFADLAGFSAFAEEASIAESAAVASRLEGLASEVARAPVRLVKLIGDAAMLVSDSLPALVAALVELRDTAAGIDGFPGVRIGLAAGEVVVRAGDVYGPAVNLASRLSDAAEPGQILLPADARSDLPDRFEARDLEPRVLKGVGEVRPAAVL